MNKFLNVYNKAGYMSLSFSDLKEALQNGQTHESDYLYTIEYNENGVVSVHRPPMEEGYYEVAKVAHGGKLILYYNNYRFSYHKEDKQNAWSTSFYRVIRKVNI